jgi:DNA-binding NarL/FixJ family response regulator
MISVLLVDDNATFLQAATRFLQQYKDITVVGTACGGQEAVPIARTLQPDVALVDLSMPDLPGLELIPRLRLALPKIRIIALTLLDSAAYQRAALAVGADGLVSKRRMSTKLLPAIRQAVPSNAVMEPQ